MSKKGVFKKVLISILVIIIGMAGVFFVGLQMKLKAFSNEVNSIEVNDIDLSTLKDGKYKGEYYVDDTVGATVEVTVKENKITNINFIEHKYGKGKKAEVITEKVINQQSLKVDTVSGATGSSIIILKAIEDALSQ